MRIECAYGMLRYYIYIYVEGGHDYFVGLKRIECAYGMLRYYIYIYVEGGHDYFVGLKLRNYIFNTHRSTCVLLQNSM